jgi:hypothetical protein
MNCVENLKLTQWRKLFKIFKSSPWNVWIFFEHGKASFLNLQFKVDFGNLKNYLTSRAHTSAPHFRLTARDGHPVQCAAPILSGHRSSPPTWVGPSLALLRTSPRKSSPTLLFPSPVRTHSSLLCSVPVTASPARYPSPMSNPELSDRAKRSASSLHPSCTKSLSE